MVEDDKGRFYKFLLNLLVHWNCMQNLGNACMPGVFFHFQFGM